MPASGRRRVALVSDADSFGGAETYLVNLVGALAAECAFTALVPAGADEAAAALADRGARVVRIPGLGRVPGPRALSCVAAALRAAHAEVVHVNTTDQGDGLTAILAAAAVRRPAVVTVHLGLSGRPRSYERLAAWQLRRARAVIAVSPGVAAHLRGLGVRATTILNGVPAPVVDPDARARLGAAPDRVLVAGIGRLTPQKGWDVLCAAAAGLGDVADVVIVGEGPERERLAGPAAAAGVRLLGARPHAAGLLSGVDVLAAPSRFEGLPLALMEALHAGVPVVAADIPGIREVIGDAGILVTPEDPGALADALARLCADPRRRAELADRGRARAAERFTVDRMARETLAAYGLRMSA